jgi:hypothetical protein
MAIELSSGLSPPPKTNPVSRFTTIPSVTDNFAFYMSPAKFSFLFMKIYIFCLLDFLLSAQRPKIRAIGASRYV